MRNIHDEQSIRRFFDDPIKKYKPVGRCIYCGVTKYSKDKVQLSDEHIIPFALGGKLVLPNSSCERCADVTSSLERYICKKMLSNPRTIAQFPTRRPKDRPKTLPVRICKDRELEEADIARVPLVLMLPVFQRAGYLDGRRPEQHFRSISAQMFVATTSPDMEWHRSELDVHVELNPSMFCRFLAKISHAFAVAELGFYKYTPMILPLIFGISPTAPFFVGTESAFRDQDHNKLHDISVVRNSKNYEENIVVNVRLFSCFGMPNYEIVVGVSPTDSAPSGSPDSLTIVMD